LIAPPSIWSISGEELEITNGVLVGVLNVTPDSFSDGGEFTNPKVAISHGLEMVEMGAGIVDVGGESTRPGAFPVAEDEELRRVIPVVEGLAASGVRVSIDTYKPGVARSALDGGAVIVNDVTGFELDAMIDVVVESDCGVVAIHMQGSPADMHIDPRYDDVVAEVEAYLLGSIDRLEQAGVDRARIAIDPGIGFGKRARHSLALLGNLDRLARHGVPVMVGTSRKGFLGKVTGDETREGKDRATAVTTALAYARGVRLFRVHDVAKSRDALAVAGAIVAHQ
jgi:dihydropteroate synthase